MRRVFILSMAWSVFLNLFVWLPAFSQDALYQTDGKKVLCKIVEVSDKKVKYKNLQNITGPSYSVEAADLLIAFNENGNYLVFPVAPSSTAGTASSSAFLNAPTKKNFDILLTQGDEVIASLIESSTDKEVKYKTAPDGKKTQTISRAKLKVILYKHGKHELLVNPTEAASGLQKAKTQIDELTGVDNSIPAQQVSNSGHSPDALEFPGGPEEFEKFKNKALIKTDELGTYLKTISDVKTSAEKSNSAINLAVGLFVNEEARVEVSNVLSGKKNKYKVRDYLKRLKLKSSEYDKIEIEYADISYATDFTKGPDGRYYGVVKFVQSFKGFIDGKVVYGDITERNVTVILKVYEKAKEGQVEKQWDVFLADVGITETRK